MILGHIQIETGSVVVFVPIHLLIDFDVVEAKRRGANGQTQLTSEPSRHPCQPSPSTRSSRLCLRQASTSKRTEDNSKRCLGRPHHGRTVIVPGPASVRSPRLLVAKRAG
jgi:hypothetical protein